MESKLAKTDGSAARSIAGFVDNVDSIGVWVRFDGAAVQSYLAGVILPES